MATAALAFQTWLAAAAVGAESFLFVLKRRKRTLRRDVQRWREEAARRRYLRWTAFRFKLFRERRAFAAWLASRNVRRLLRRRTEALVKQGREYLKEGRARIRRQGGVKDLLDDGHRASGRRLSTTVGITGAPHVDFVATLRSPQPPSAVARTPSRTPLRAVTADTGPPPTAGGEGWEDYLAQRFPECTSPASVSWPSPMREVDFLDVSPRRAAGAPAESTFRTWRRDGSPATPKRATPKGATPAVAAKAASPSPRRRAARSWHTAPSRRGPRIRTTPFDAAWPGVPVGVPVPPRRRPDPVVAAGAAALATAAAARAAAGRVGRRRSRASRRRARSRSRDADPASIEARRAAWAAPTADASRAASFKERRKQLMERQKPPPAPTDRCRCRRRGLRSWIRHRDPRKRQQPGARWAGSHWEW